MATATDLSANWGTLLTTYLKRYIEEGLTHQQVAAEGPTSTARRR